MAARKKSARKKTTAVKKKTTAKKKATAKKKPVVKAKKRQSTKKKVAAKKKTAAARKTASKKKATAKKKVTAKKKTAAAGKSASKKKTTARKKPVSAKATKQKSVSEKSMPKAAKPSARKQPRSPEEIRPGFTPYQAKKNEDYMNADQVEHFRNILLDWKRELMEEVDRTVHHMQDEVANYPDPNDRATVEEEFALELRTRDRERKLINKINESLADLQSGDYGYCEVCGVEIGIRRLEARPTATLCIDCKTLDEIKERQYG